MADISVVPQTISGNHAKASPLVSAAAAPSTPSLRITFGWALAGNIIYAVCQWGALVLLARLATPHEVGIYSIAMAIGLPLSMVANLNLRVLLVTDLKDEYRLSDILGLRYAAGMLACLIAGTIVAASGYDVATAATIVLMTLAQLVESISDSFYGVLQRMERMDRIALSMAIRAACSLAVFGVLAVGTHSLWCAVGAMLLVRLLVLYVYDIQPGTLDRVRENSRFAALRATWNHRVQAAIFWKIAPLGLVQVLASFNGNIPRYFVESCCGHSILGVFAALSVLPTAGMMLVSSLGQAAFPRLVKAAAASPSRDFRILLRRLLLVSLLLGACGIVGAAWYGEWILRLLYGPQYAPYATLLVWLMIAGTCGYATSAFGNALTAASQFAVQLPVLLVVTLVTVVSGALLIPRYSVTGAALVMILAAVAQCGMMAALAYRSSMLRSRSIERPEILH